MSAIGSGLRSKQEIVSLFGELKSEVDNYQDTREKLIKTSRDITRFSKRLISHLHHVVNEGVESGQEVAKIVGPEFKQIEHLFARMKLDLEGDKFWRYQRVVSPGTQEYIEALSFAHYLSHGSLISWREAQDRLSDESGSPYFPLPIEDYLLGVSDLTGELMRYAIAGIARKGGRATAAAVCTFVRQCKADFDTLTPYLRELAKKQRVTVESLHKIEDVAYAVAIRCYEYDLPHDILDDIVSRTLDTNRFGETQGRHGDEAESGYF